MVGAMFVFEGLLNSSCFSRLKLHPNLTLYRPLYYYCCWNCSKFWHWFGCPKSGTFFLPREQACGNQLQICGTKPWKNQLAPNRMAADPTQLVALVLSGMDKSEPAPTSAHQARCWTEKNTFMLYSCPIANHGC